jgi:YD repeat-containing protein
MGALRINHVSIHARDLEESARFYEEVFSMKRLPTARFAAPALWLELGAQQLHLFLREGQPQTYQHLAIDVDDFERVYMKAKDRGYLDKTLGASVREHPAGWVQMYLRDPAGNLVEVDWPDAKTLDRSVVVDITPLEKVAAQTGEAATATLYHRQS